MKKIDSIKIKHTPDYDSDVSYLGEYTDNLTDGIIVRKFEKFYEDLTDDELEDIPGRSNEYRGFKPMFSNKSDGLFQYNQMERINNGDIGFIGISVEASVKTSLDGKNWLVNTLSSGGLWGIESDSGDEYIKEIEGEQISELKDVLKEYGFSDSEIESAFKNISEA